MRKKNVLLSENNDEMVNGNDDKIELLSCPHGSQSCKEHLLFINKNYSKALNYHLEKDYLSSIEMLKSAYYKAAELQESQCLQCSSVFRSTIIQSLENIKNELQGMTSGIFKKKQYLKSYKKSCAVLNDLIQSK